MSYGISYGSFSREILVGRLNKAGNEFLAKEPHTIEAALAVVEWVLNAHGGEVDLTPKTGGVAYRITVTEVEGME